METFEDRLRRFLFGSPNEVFLTILNSISNFTLPELCAATDAGLYNLSLLGAHSVMQIIGEQIYGKTGIEATTFYLKNFVDGDTDDTKFSTIAEELHTFRNVHAHRWSSRFNHAVGFDTGEEKGWWHDDDGLHINPIIFMKCFSAGFRGQNRMMWRQFDELTALRRKYRYLRQWLEVEKDTPVWKEIRALEECTDLGTAKKQEVVTRGAILAHFGMENCG